MQKHIVCGAVSLCVAAATLFSATAMAAEKPLHHLQDPVVVDVQSIVSVQASKAQDQFEATLSEDYTNGERVIPAGTRISGYVTQVVPSRHFGRPGRVSLALKEATLPNGDVLTFKVDHTAIVHHEKAATIPKLLKNALPFLMVGLSDGIPLAAATDLSALIIMPISAGARMSAGAVWEGSKQDARPMHHKIGYGMLRGTGLTGAKAFVMKSPEPHYLPASQCKLTLGKENAQDLFEFAVNHEAQKQTHARIPQIEGHGPSADQPTVTTP